MSVRQGGYAALKMMLHRNYNIKIRNRLSKHRRRFRTKRRLRNDRTKSIPKSFHYPDLGNASDWLKQIFISAQPIRSHFQIESNNKSSVKRFLCSFFRRHLADKTVVAPRFLRLAVVMSTSSCSIDYLCPSAGIPCLCFDF